MSPIHRTEPLAFRFYASETGSEPVRAWLDTLSKAVRNRIGTDMRKVQIGWPLIQTSSYVGSFRGGLWEIRSTHDGSEYRVLFCARRSPRLEKDHEENARQRSNSRTRAHVGRDDESEEEQEGQDVMSNKNKHLGSPIDDYFKNDGSWEEIKLQAEKELLVEAIERRMAKLHLSKAEVARRMRTSRSRLDAVLNPRDTGLTMKTIASVCSALGLDFSVQVSTRRRASA